MNVFLKLYKPDVAWSLKQRKWFSNCTWNVCVCLQFDYIQAEETQLSGLWGAFFLIVVYLCFQRKLDTTEMIQFQWKLTCRHSKIMCVFLNKNPCIESFFRLMAQVLHFPLLGKLLLALPMFFSSEMDQVLWDIYQRFNFLISLGKKRELNVFNVLFL